MGLRVSRAAGRDVGLPRWSLTMSHIISFVSTTLVIASIGLLLTCPDEGKTRVTAMRQPRVAELQECGAAQAAVTLAASCHRTVTARRRAASQRPAVPSMKSVPSPVTPACMKCNDILAGPISVASRSRPCLRSKAEHQVANLADRVANSSKKRWNING